MTSNYNFDEIDTTDRPEVIMGGHKYLLRYPTMEELEKIQDMKTDEERTEALYVFFEKTTEEQPSIKETLKKQDVRILRAFSAMAKKEFGVE